VVMIRSSPRANGNRKSQVCTAKFSLRVARRPRQPDKYRVAWSIMSIASPRWVQQKVQTSQSFQELPLGTRIRIAVPQAATDRVDVSAACDHEGTFFLQKAKQCPPPGDSKPGQRPKVQSGWH